MRKTATGIIILAILLCAILWNGYNCNSMLAEIDSLVKEAENLASKGNYSSSAEKMGAAISRWAEAEHYLKSFMRHTETDSAFHALREAHYHLLRGEDGNFSIVHDRIKDLVDMERISLSSIF